MATSFTRVMNQEKEEPPLVYKSIRSKQSSHKKEEEEARKIIRHNRNNIIILSIALLLISCTIIVIACNATTTTTTTITKTTSLSRLVVGGGGDGDGSNDCCPNASSNNYIQRIHDDGYGGGAGGSGNQSVHQSDHPLPAAVVIGQRVPLMKLPQPPAYLGSASAKEEEEEEQTTIDEQLHPSHDHENHHHHHQKRQQQQHRQKQKQGTAAIAATGTDRWRAFNKCNSSSNIGIEFDKQLAMPIKTASTSASAVDNRNGRKGGNRSSSSSKRIRRHVDVGQASRLGEAGIFVGHHQTSFSSVPLEAGLFSWPRGKRQQSSSSSSSLSIGGGVGGGERASFRMLESLEGEPLIGSANGPQSGQLVAGARGSRTSASSSASKRITAAAAAEAAATVVVAAAAAAEDTEEDDDDEEATDVEPASLSARASKLKTGRDNKGQRHVRASSDGALANGEGSSSSSSSSPGQTRYDGEKGEQTVREIRRGRLAQQTGTKPNDTFRRPDNQGDSTNDGVAAHQDYGPSDPATTDAGEPTDHRQRQYGSELVEEDDQIISHYNLIELVDDDLFLAQGSPPVKHSFEALAPATTTRSSSSSSGRQVRASRSGGSSSSLVSDKMRTIYFGGFFPWLADEDTRFNDNSASYANNHEGRNRSYASPERRQVNNNEPANLDSGQRPWLKRKQQQRRRMGQQYETSEELSTTVSPHQQHSAAAATAAASGPTLLPQSGQLQLQQQQQLTQGSVSSSSIENNNRHQLGRFILPAVRLALDHINTNSSILDTYKLEIVPRDTQCNATISLKEFFDMVYEEPKKMLLYGDACRVSTDPIAKASYFFDLIQISYADTDPIYTIENYPNFFRVVPSENALSLARIPFIRHFNWTRVGTIYQNLPRYSLPHSKLLTDLERFKIVIKQSVSLPGSIDGLQNRDLGDELRKLKEKDVRIILGNFDEEWALLLFCEAYRARMTGRKYQWILTGVSEDKLWQHYLKKGSECSEQELLIAMDGYIITDITPVTRSQHRTISGMMAHEYSNEYKRRAREMNIAIEENKFYGYVYDGIWAIALALHRVDSQLRYYNRLVEAGKVKLSPELQGITSLLDFDYHKPIWVKLIRQALNKTRFNGVTGTVSFHKNERPGLISFSQFQAFRDMNEVIIGSYDALNDELDLKVGFPIFWRGSSPPIDYTIERVTPFRINRTLFVIISILALFGIVLATVFLTINIKCRNQRYIKMSSPYLNNLIIIGCILTYTSVIILGLDSGLTSELNFPYICNARAWVLMAGFTLAFGSMFSKTFRVHSIFTNIKLHKKVIKDYKLFMVVFILLTFDVCILIVWQYFDPFYRETNNGTSIQDPDNEDILIVPEMEHCQSKRMTIFLSVIYVYKGLLMAFGCFLAWETRHVSIPALNDSKYIGLSVYNVVIMCVIGAGLSFVLRDQQDASFVIISIFIIFCSTTTLCLVFVPKLIELKQNPRAGDHRVRATLKTFKKNYHEEAFGAAGCRDIHGNIIGRGYGINLNERIKILLDENTKQRSSLKEKTYELEALTYKYRKIQGLIQSGQYLQALSSTGSSSNLKQAAGQSLLGNELSPKAATTHLTAKNQNQNQCSTFARASPEIGTQISECLKNGQLQKSSMMSSVTQINTTTTNVITSSTNTTSDSANDYSSSKPTSKLDSATNGNCCTESFDSSSQAKQATLVAFKCDINDGRPVVSKANDGGPGRAQKASILVDPAKKRVATMATQPISSEKTQFKQHSPKYTAADSSYCSMGADYELSDARKSSQDNLFNVLSYIEDGTANQGARVNQGDANETKISRCEYVESKFNRWSTGPFCTLMVRNTPDQHTISGGIHANEAATSAGKQLSENYADNQSARTGEEVRASCPDIAAKSAIRLAKQTASYRQNSNSTSASVVAANKRARLPRTISMIEYLGLSEFDFIAKRHDKLVRQKLQAAKRRQGDYCCIDENNNHCPCCGHNTDNRPSDVFSSGDFRDDSGDLVRTGSHISCSTCCSLMSPSYVSHSDYMFDENSHSSGSSSSDQSSSNSSEDSGSLSGANCNSQSKSSTQSSTYENKESTIQNMAMPPPCSALRDKAQTPMMTKQIPGAMCSHHHKQKANTPYHEHGPTTKVHQATCAHFVGGSSGQQSLCTSGVLHGPGSREDTNCCGQVCSTKLMHHQVTSPSLSPSGNNILEDLADSDQEAEETTSVIKCDILQSL